MPSCPLGFESVKTVIMKSFKSHFHIWNLIMSLKLTGAVSQRKISILKYPSHLLSAVFPLPPHNTHPIQKQQSLYCSPAPCWASLHACLGHPPLPLRLPHYFYEELALGGEAQDVAVEGWAQGQGQGFLSMSVLMASPVFSTNAPEPSGAGKNGVE